MQILETERLVLRHFDADDAPFILELVNDPAWIRFVGDRNIHTLDVARDYIANGPVAMYKSLGFGLYMTALKESGTPIGMCGLLKRDSLDDVDIGFAFLPQYTGKGFGYESAAAVLAYARDTLGLARVVAITSHDNEVSMALLRKLGMSFVKTVPAPGEEHPLNLFALDL